MLLTNNLVWPRSLFFAFMCAAALLTALTHPATTLAHLRRAGPALWLPLIWALWCAASLMWTADPRFSLREWKTEIGYNTMLVIACLIALRDWRDVRTLITAILAAFVILGIAAIAATLTQGGFDPSRWHHDVGVWSTHLTLIAPLLLLVAFAPASPRGRRLGFAALAALIILLFINARLTDNRIVWLAFAAVYGVAAALIAWRGRHARGALRWRYALIVGALFAVLAIAFANVLRDKAELHYPSAASVSEALGHDPRIELWKAAFDKIRTVPWLGHGYGRDILRNQLPAELHNRVLTHPHNALLSQSLQTGVIGLTLYVAMMGALLWRYIGDARSQTRLRALVGIVGIGLIAGFAVKNLTDDFFIRSNAKLFWVLNATLLAAGALAREDEARVSRSA
jgi:O-antigen ligase